MSKPDNVVHLPERVAKEPWWFWPMFAVGILAVMAMAWGGG